MQGAIAHDVLRGPDRIQVGQIGLWHETQHFAVGRAPMFGSAKSPAAPAAAPVDAKTRVVAWNLLSSHPTMNPSLIRRHR